MRIKLMNLSQQRNSVEIISSYFPLLNETDHSTANHSNGTPTYDTPAHHTTPHCYTTPHHTTHLFVNSHALQQIGGRQMGGQMGWQSAGLLMSAQRVMLDGNESRLVQH